jgi:hypothetical protein
MRTVKRITAAIGAEQGEADILFGVVDAEADAALCSVDRIGTKLDDRGETKNNVEAMDRILNHTEARHLRLAEQLEKCRAT